MADSKQIIHVDMDAFYASVEQHDDPSLKGKPVIVGGTPQSRGVVSAASYEARKHGVHSAMPMARALRMCPHAIIKPVRMSRYAQISKQIRKLFHDFTPLVEPISIDEAFLDVTGSVRLFDNDIRKLGRKIKSDIRETTGLDASIGLAPNKFLAKLASDLDKPDGFVIITEENKQQILDPLNVSKIWGIGKVAAKALNDIGITTILELRNTPADTLSTVFKNQSEEILRLAQGIDDRQVETEHETKSISSEETFARDISDKEILLKVLHSQVEEVSQRLRANNLEARTVTLKLRYADFRTITRSSTFESTNVTKSLLGQAQQLFSKWHKMSAGPLRLLGFGASGLSPEQSGQKLLFSDPEDEKQKNIDRVCDMIRNKFGDNALKRGN